MPTIRRVRVGWSGGALVGPGVSTFYFGGAASGFVTDLVVFFDAIRNRFPTTLTWTIPNTGDELDSATGELTGSWTDGVGGALAGTSGTSFAQGVGIRLTWETGTVGAGRRIRGATYLAPLVNACFDLDGTPNPAFVGSIDTAAQALVTASSGDMLVFSRPRPGIGGGTAPVTSVRLPDKVSWLRSRRT